MSVCDKCFGHYLFSYAFRIGADDRRNKMALERIRTERILFIYWLDFNERFQWEQYYSLSSLLTGSDLNKL